MPVDHLKQIFLTMPGDQMLVDRALAEEAERYFVSGRHHDLIAADRAANHVRSHSSGPHSNGYSLIRKLLKTAKATPTTKLEGGLLYDALMAPTRIYVKALLELAKVVPVRSFAHITGGGLTENIPRVIPAGLEVMLSAQTWKQPAVFDWLQKAGSIPAAEMYRTFNCGIGMVVCVGAEHADKAIKSLTEHGEQPLVIGEVRRGDGGVIIRQ